MPSPQHLRMLSFGVAVAAALAVYAETLRWLWRVPFAGEDRRLNLALLLGFVGLLIHRGLQHWRQPAAPESGDLRDGSAATTPALPLVLCLGATALHVVVEHTLQASTLTAILAVLAAYGLFGCFVSRAQFHGGLPSVLLGIGLLPFASLAEGYIGLGARLVTAEIVQQLLSTLHIGVVPAHTILLLERGIAHIDIPCSGLRGLWSGLVCYLLLTWLERRRVGGRFWLGLLLMQGLLFGANVLRVFVLVYVAQVLGASRLAEALHVPLGLLGFAVGVAFAFAFLRYAVPALPTASGAPQVPSAARARPSWRLAKLPRRVLPQVLAGVFVLMAMGDRMLPRPQAGGTRPPPRLPGSLAAVAVPLSPGEREIFGRFGAQAGKWRLPGGSLIVVRSPGLTAFRAHHPPEVCLLSAGLRVVRTEPVELSPGVLARHLTLTERAAVAAQPLGPSGPQRQGLYWFQSATSTTPDILTRIFRQIRHREPWLMVTLLSEAERGGSKLEASAELLRMAREIHATLDDSLRAAHEPAAPSMQ